MSMRGFSLLEMAVVLALLGLVFVLLSTPLIRALRSDSGLRAKKELEQAYDTLIGYAQTRTALPQTLAAAGQTKDMFGNVIAYRADSGLISVNICDGSLDVSAVTELSVMTSDGIVPHVAFILGTAGQDKQQAIDFAATPVDVRDPGDDPALYCTWYELRAATCTAAEDE